MIYRCPNCNGALEYNPQTDQMDCKFCGNSYEPEQEKLILENEDTMDCRIYSCTSCGGELLVNDVEASTFCAYCGQPTVVFSRVSKEVKPDCIIPFRVTRDEAFRIVRQRFSKGALIPKEIKQFKIENMRGIYIPYFIYDIDYQDTQGLEHEAGRKGIDRYYIRKAEGEFRGILHDASKILNDESTIRLEPYDLRELRPFEPQYLSGFYADKYDLNQQEIEANGVKRAKQFFDEEIQKSIGETARIRDNRPTYQIRKIRYALLPAWFITFRYKNEPYTILINGQTGKMVGTIPVNKGGMWRTFLLAWLIFTIVLLPLSPIMPTYIGLGGWILILVAALRENGKINENMEVTGAKSTVKYVKERQEQT